MSVYPDSSRPVPEDTYTASSVRGLQDMTEQSIRDQIRGRNLPPWGGVTSGVGKILSGIGQAFSFAFFGGLEPEKTFEEIKAIAVHIKSKIDAEIKEALDKAEAANEAAELVREEMQPTIEGLGVVSGDLKALTDGLSAQIAAGADKQITESATIKGLQSSTSAAVEQAGSALDIVSNPVEIGDDVLVVRPETRLPQWADGLQQVNDTIEGVNVVAWRATAATVTDFPLGGSVNNALWVKVDPRVDYVVSGWMKSSQPWATVMLEFENERGQLVSFKGGTADTGSDGVTEVAPWVSPVNEVMAALHRGDGQWDSLETHDRFRFPEGTERVRLRRAAVTDAAAVSSLSFRPLVPRQADVDEAQNKAIESLAEVQAIHEGRWDRNSQLWKEQDRINQLNEDYKELNDKLWNDQDSMNARLIETDDGLLEANKTILRTRTRMFYGNPADLVNRPITVYVDNKIAGTISYSTRNGPRLSFFRQGDWTGKVHFIVKWREPALGTTSVDMGGYTVTADTPEGFEIGGTGAAHGNYIDYVMHIIPD